MLYIYWKSSRALDSVDAAASTEILRKSDFEEIWFCTLDFCTKVPFTLHILSKYDSLDPQYGNPNDGPV